MKVGILGGGQLGRMLLQASANYVVETYVLEKDNKCPAAAFCTHFVKGDITSFEDVYKFGKSLDCITIEIENVNIEALEKLEKKGVKVYPRPAAIRIIRDKILQKEFYREHSIPTADFRVTNNLADIEAARDLLPAVHKMGQGGYDGKGVKVLRDEKDIAGGFSVPSVLEKLVSIKKEIAVIVAINEKGEAAVYPLAEMVFDPLLHLLDYQLSPAAVPDGTKWKAEAVALKVVQELKSPGLFAVELFLDEKNDILVNETAPRVHNSGHHTIEANYCSQYDMLWRILLGYPLGNTKPILPSALLNIIGDEQHKGNAKYEGLPEVLQMDNVFVHLYGKEKTQPGRKMGHVTILNEDYAALTHQAKRIRQMLRW